MAELVPGITYEQKVVTVASDDTSMNTEITTQAEDGWILNFITISGGNSILLFSRQIETEALP